MNGGRWLSLCLLVVTAVLLSPMTSLGGAVIDDFDGYETGLLSVVSGGTWRVWNNGTNDAQVIDTESSSSPNAVLFDNTSPDMVAYTNNNLLAGGTVTLSFDFYSSEVEAGGLALVVYLSAGDSATNTVDYSSTGTHLVMGGYNSYDGEVEIYLYGSDYISFPYLGSVTGDEWHNLTWVLSSTGTFDIYVDGVLIADDYAYTSSGILNCVEIYSGSVADRSYGYHLIDNLSLTGVDVATVPVPGAMLLVSLGSGAVALCRRKRIL